MSISKETIEKVYRQIDNFNNAPSNPEIENSKPVVDAYLYVSREVAEDRADFFKWLIKESKIEPFQNLKINNVLDLAFGSGNLTSHILLDASIEYQKVFLNDKITDNTNQEIELPSHEILDYDFLNYSAFQDKFKESRVDLLVFNPQIGGSYIKGKFDPEENATPIIYDGNILEYLKDKRGAYTEDIKTKYFSKDYLIYLRTKKHSKGEIESWIGKSLFNYQDIAYHPKSSKNTYIFGKKTTHEERNRTKISLLRNTIDSSINEEHTILFYGKEKHFNLLFADYNFVIRYKTRDKGEDLFVAKKAHYEKTFLCFEKRNNKYEECAVGGFDKSYDDIDVNNVVDQINSELSLLRSLEGEELTPLKLSEGTSEEKPKCKKRPFRNFLLEE